MSGVIFDNRQAGAGGCLPLSEPICALPFLVLFRSEASGSLPENAWGTAEWIGGHYRLRAPFGSNELETRTDGALRILEEPERVHALTRQVQAHNS